MMPTLVSTMTDEVPLYMHDVMHEYEELWKKYMTPWDKVNTVVARNFLTRMQYDVREIGLLTDDEVVQHAKHIVRWMLKAKVYVQPLPSTETEECAFNAV